MKKFTDAMLVHIARNGLLKKFPGTNKWRVEEPFIFYLDYEKKDKKIIVPVGFITDFGSIHPFLRIFLNPTKYISYIMHDRAYSVNGNVTRYEADLALISGMHIEGARMWEILLVFLGVRIFGFLYFKK